MFSSLAQKMSQHRRVSVGVTAGVLTLGLAGALLVVQHDDSLAFGEAGPGDRVLQSVDVGVGTDGAIEGVKDHVVISDSDGEQAGTDATTYNPSKVADDLPVRVLTSYRAGDRSGTDLSDLDGYSGRVTIDVSVENLTTHARQISYDAAGQGHQTTAIVGAPLTVVGAVDLGDLDPSAIVTQDESGEATNGALSQSSEGQTQIQWATILAPPQLSSSATLRMVADVKNFDVPAIDLSVQPGLVTDPSMGALVDSAFNPAASDERELQTRTISLIGDVNDVLGRAGKTIQSLRRTLNDTSKELGAKTVDHLKGSTKLITTSMKSYAKGLRSLSDDVESAMKNSRASTVASLKQMVDQLNGVLGDTSATATARVSGSGCKQVVSDPKKQGSLYAQLVEVTAQLDGYATATDNCKVQLRRAILRNIGPEHPTPETCQTPSATCAMYDVESDFRQIADQMVADGKKTVDELISPEGRLGDTADNLVSLSKQLDALVDEDPDNGTVDDKDLDTTLDGIDHAAGLLSDTLDAMASETDTVHDQAEGLWNEIGQVKDSDPDNNGPYDEATSGSMQQQNLDLADHICGMRLSDTQEKELLAYVTGRTCPDADGNTDPIPGLLGLLPPSVDPMVKRLAEVSDGLNDIMTATDVERTDTDQQGLGPRLQEMRDHLTALQQHLDDANATFDEDDPNVVDTTHDLRSEAQDMQQRVQQLNDDWEQQKQELKEKFEQHGKDAKQKISDSIDPSIRQIYDQGQDSADAVSNMFTRSVRGLRSAADQIRKNGKATVTDQKKQLAEARKQAEELVNGGTGQVLKLISDTVGSSTKDLDAIRTMLTKDLNNILLDLGQRKANGPGLLGAMATAATKADSANYQLSLAGAKSSGYARVQAWDVNGMMLRQAQAEASMEEEANLPPFVMKLPEMTEFKTVYRFRVAKDA